MKKPRHRIFDYQPRYYIPENDRQEKIKKRLGFKRMRNYKTKRKNPFIWLILIVIIVYLYMKFGRLI